MRHARAVDEARAAPAVGVRMTAQVDFAAVMAAVRARQADLAPHDSAARLAGVGVHLFFGAASFAGRRSLTVEGRTLRFRRAVIATGSRPAVPDVPGLASTPYLTSDSLFRLTEQPRALLILGAGPIDCEMAQAFALLGTMVTLAEAATTWGYIRPTISKSTVGRWLKDAALKPHRIQRWLHSPDPDFRRKVRRVVRRHPAREQHRRFGACAMILRLEKPALDARRSFNLGQRLCCVDSEGAQCFVQRFPFG